jgi:hypothetical protein
MGHWLAGALTVVTAALFGHPWLGALAVLLWAGPKEFWYDMHYEDPATSGGLVGGIKDFFYYCFGGACGLGVAFLHALT